MTAAQSTPVRAPGRPWALAEAAECLGVSSRTLMRLSEAGKLKLMRLGTGRGRVLIADAELRRIAEGK